MEEERAAWKRQQALNLLADTPEKRREKDIEKELERLPQPPPVPSASEAVKPVKSRTQHVKRPRPSEEIQPPTKIKTKTSKGKEKKVNFGSEGNATIPPPARSTSPTYSPPEYSTTSHPGPSELSPSKASNPFEEVLLRSAQRPKPVFSDDMKGLPRFQPVAPLRLAADPGPSGSESSVPGQDALSNEEVSSDVPVPRQSRMGKSARSHKRSPPGKHRAGDPTQKTPPIFTHRRVVGKRHQYAPAVPSPLSKIIKAADTSMDRSLEDDREDNSLSPSQAVVGASAVRDVSKKSNAQILPLIIVPGAEEDEDEDGVWLPVEPDAAPRAEIREADDNPLYMGPNLAPLTEDDLMIAPKPKLFMTNRKGPIASKPPFRPATLASRPMKFPSVSRPKEKENAAEGSELQQGSKPSRAITSPLKAPPTIITGKVVMGKSTAKGSLNVKPAQPQAARIVKRPVKTASSRPPQS